MFKLPSWIEVHFRSKYGFSFHALYRKKKFPSEDEESVRRCEECVVEVVAQNTAFNGAQKKHVTLITGGWVGVAF
jgi:hypothetical protein